MATMVMYGRVGMNAFGGDAGADVPIDFLTDTIKVSLHTTTYAPDVDAHEFYSDLTNELATANGYTNGGLTMGAKAVTYVAAGNKTVFDNTVDPTWTAAGGSLVFRYAIFRKDTGVPGTSPLIGYYDFGTQTITDTNTVTILLDATDGIFKVTAT